MDLELRKVSQEVELAAAKNLISSRGVFFLTLDGRLGGRVLGGWIQFDLDAVCDCWSNEGDCFLSLAHACEKILIGLWLFWTLF